VPVTLLLPGAVDARRVFRYYFVLRDDHIVESLRLVGAVAEDPLLRVDTVLSDGRSVPWERRVEGDELAFYPPDREDSRMPAMRYDDRVQRHEPMGRPEMEKRALRFRHSA
jgi:hypothetical protein